MSQASLDSEKQSSSYLAYLLLSLFFLLLFVPIIEGSSLATGLLRVGFTAVLVTAAVATRRRKQWIIAGLFVASIVAPLSWMTMFIDQPLLFLATCLLEGAFFITMAVVILVSVIQKHMATIHSIFGAICGYLLLGLAFAVVYWGIDQVDDQALQFNHRVTSSIIQNGQPQETTAFSQVVYFSFVTMSTLGYGDIFPRSSIVQTLAWMQSVMGQFYIAVLVAWMVSEIPRQRALRQVNKRSPDS